MNRPLAIILIIMGMLVLLAVTVALFAAWNAFLAISSVPAKVLVILGVLMGVAFIGFLAKRAYLAWLDVQFVKEELATKQRCTAASQ